MEHTSHEHVIIIGCGRVGVELAMSISHQGFAVTVVDPNEKAFDRLGADFRGRTVCGDAFDQSALKRAGIETAHALAAATSSDSVNIVAAKIARDIYNVKHVVARVYNPHRMSIYEKLGLQTVASSSWGAQRIEQLLLHPGLQSVCSAGNGEVQVYEIPIPEEWSGRRIGDLIPADESLPVAITRGGKAALAAADMVMQPHDILHVGATAKGAGLLRQHLHLKRER